METAFVPARGLEHPIAQTVYPLLARRPRPLPAKRERWETPDGDFLEVDIVAPAGGAPPRGFAIVLHGLEGSSRAPYARGLLRLARARGLVGYGVNFRSCGGTPNRLLRTYHSGETGDLRFAVRTVIERHPGLRGALVGFSLGANVALKWLGEEGRAAPAAIAGAVAISCPFDLGACAERLDRPENWWLRASFIAAMKRKALAKAARFPGALDRRAILRASTFRAFDDAVTARIFGFRDAADYWRRASCAPFLSSIARPALAISALDDPLIPASCVSLAAARASRAVAFVAPTRGGHVGFVSGTALAPRWWAEERAMEFIERLLAP